ncbi:hypothetical protein [Bradyrhizobium sp. USDA 4454]
MIGDLIEQRYGRRIAEIRQDVQAVPLTCTIGDVVLAKARTHNHRN